MGISYVNKTLLFFFWEGEGAKTNFPRRRIFLTKPNCTTNLQKRKFFLIKVKGFFFLKILTLVLN
jgi:hypothetical protein